jgi:hypothetical protein
MVPIRYQVVGEEDYAFTITIEDSGAFTVENETYTSQPPRKGELNKEQEQALISAIKDLGVPREHPMPEGGTAFEAQLTIGPPGEQVTYVFWEGALEEDGKLSTLIRMLEVL